MFFVRRHLAYLWRRLTPSKDVEQAGEHEKAFLESVYRVCYLIGFSRTDRSTAYRVYANVVHLIASILVLIEAMYPFMANLSLDEIVSSFNASTIHFVTVWQITSMMNHKDLYRKLAKSMESPYFDVSTERRKKIMDYWAKGNDMYFQTLIKMGTCTIIAWNAFPMIDDLEYNLMVDVYLPYTYDSTLRYFFSYLLVLVAFSYASYYVIMSQCILQAHLYTLICQFAVLADCFENIIEDCATELEETDFDLLIKDRAFLDRYVKRLGNLITQHTFILNNTMDMKAILSGPMLGLLSSTGLLICFVAFQAITTVTENRGKFFMSLLYLGCVMYTFYKVCASCEEIAVQSRKVAEAAYFSGWESGLSLVPGVRNTILIVMMRSNKPLIFLAGGMYTISLNSYLNLVKTSYSFFSLLYGAKK